MGVPHSNNFTQAMLYSGVSGITERFLQERQKRNGQLASKDWFDPYLNNFVDIARKSGVELYNKDIDNYGTRQDVVDDVCSIKKHQDGLPLDKQKEYDSIAHDVILWHLVKDNRPALVESPIDAKDWILTIDYKFIGFDKHKLKSSSSKVPLCLHPTALIQLLQFWVPRTKEFEEAVLGGLSLPFLFQEFDVEAEKLNLSIINKLGRFEGHENFPPETIVKIVRDDSLRSRIDQGQPENEELLFIQDALVKELQLRADKAKEEADSEKKKNDELESTVKDAHTVIVNIQTENKSKDFQLNDLQAKVDEVVFEKNKISSESAVLQQENAKLQEQLAEIENERKCANEKKAKRKAFWYYLISLISISLLSTATWYLLKKNPSVFVQYGSIPIIFSTLHWVLEHCLLKYKVKIDMLWLHKIIKMIVKWWIAAIAAIIIGLVTNYIYEKDKDKLSDALLQQTSSELILNDVSEYNNESVEK